VGVRVVTDSSAVVPDVWVADYALEIVPLQLAWPDGTIMETDPPYPEVAALLTQRGAPSTAAPSPGAFGALFERLLATGSDVLTITPPAEFSTTFSGATLAARSIGGERIRILDARTAAAGQGIVATEAARRAASVPTPNLDEVCDTALRAASRVEIWATLTQLDYLRRSGRVPAIAAIGAGALRLQPVVRYAGGNPTPVGVTRSAARASERLLRAWERSVLPGRVLRLVAFHSDREDEAGALAVRVLERVPGAETHVVAVTASLAAHTGPGLLGLAWLWD
jgi:DegV family protein with EDD domain